MRVGKDILENQLGKKLDSGQIQSFYLDNELVSKINVLYLKFDNWIHIVTNDETAIHQIERKYPTQIKEFTDNEGNKFEYPLTNLAESHKEISKFIGKRMIAFSELEMREYRGIVCGLKLDFEDNLTLITYSDAEEIVFLNLDGIIPDGLKIRTTLQKSNEKYKNLSIPALVNKRKTLKNQALFLAGGLFFLLGMSVKNTIQEGEFVWMILVPILLSPIVINNLHKVKEITKEIAIRQEAYQKEIDGK